MKKTFLLSEWKALEVFAVPTMTRAVVRRDASGNLWEWVSSGKCGKWVKAKKVLK